MTRVRQELLTVFALFVVGNVFGDPHNTHDFTCLIAHWIGSRTNPAPFAITARDAVFDFGKPTFSG